MRTAGLGALLALVLLAASGCASSPTPAPRPAESQTPPAPPVQPEPAESAPEPAESAPEPAEEPTGAYGPRTVVIGPPEPEAPATPTLAEAARKARESRAQEGEPIAVITDETLPEYAKGELTIGAEKPAGESPAEDAPETPEAEERGEEYWRQRVRGARMRWRDLVAEIERLEGEVAKLRQRFYAEDDGFYRDSQIKPAWDRALDRLAGTRDEVRRAQENLTTILQEGRLAGALPGWLREGIEYEPKPEEPETEPGIHEVTEPPVIDDDGEGDRP